MRTETKRLICNTCVLHEPYVRTTEGHNEPQSVLFLS